MIPYWSTAEIFFVLTQIFIPVLLFSVFAAEPHSAFPPFSPIPNSNSIPANSRMFSAVAQNTALTGRVENNNGKLRIVLTNDSASEFRGICKISLGNDGNQKEVGQLGLTLPPQEVVLLQVNNVPPSGDQYTLAIYDQKGVRRLLKIAPLRAVADPTPAVAVTLVPIHPQRPKTTMPLLAAGNSAAAVTDQTDEFARTALQVQIQARLLANEEANDSFLLSLELRSQRPVNNATMVIVAGKVKDSKKVSLNSQSHIEFQLPDRLDTETLSYTLTAKDGRVLAKGDLDLQELMADGNVTVNDIRTDRATYDPGESARMTVLLEGKSRHGFRLEVSAKDGQNRTFFQDQKTVRAEENPNSMEFTVSIPPGSLAPVIFEFRIFDAETGLLLDSGEREIPVSNTKPARRG